MDKTKDKRLTATMQREFDLMMYNFSDDELELYESYSRHHVAIRDPKDPNSKNNLKINNYIFISNEPSYYDPVERFCNIKFNNPSNDSDKIGDYLPRFNWNSRFHEETHHLNAIFGSDYSANYVDEYFGSKPYRVSPNLELSHPRREGKALLDALTAETLDYVNQACQAKKLHFDRFPICVTKDTKNALTPVLNKLASDRKSFNSDSALGDLTDILGLCSFGAISRDRLIDHMYKEREKRIGSKTLQNPQIGPQIGEELLHGDMITITV